MAIVKTILMLGENLGIEVVAEGIETEQQVESLKRMGCRFGQGYFFSRPITAADVRTLLDLGAAYVNVTASNQIRPPVIDASLSNQIN